MHRRNRKYSLKERNDAVRTGIIKTLDSLVLVSKSHDLSADQIRDVMELMIREQISLLD